MMSVVINNQHAIDFTLRLKPAACTCEPVQSLDDLFKRHFQFKPDRYRSECVVDVVHARYAQDHFAHYVCSTPNRKRRSEVVVVPDAMSGDISLRAKTVSQATPLEERNDRLHVWIVETQNRRAVERNFVQETREGRTQVVHVVG